MAKFDRHPTVKRWREQTANNPPVHPATLNADSLRTLCLAMGADDVGFVEIHRPAIADQHADILAAFPPTKTLISFACRMNRENVRTPARSIANLEFHANHDHADEIARNLVRALEPVITGKKSVRLSQPQCGKACLSSLTTKPLTALRYVRLERM